MSTRRTRRAVTAEDGQRTLRQLDHDRRKNDEKLGAQFEHIFRKYEHDFTGVGDEIDIATGDLVVNNGHLQYMRHEVDPGKGASSRFLRRFQEDLELEDAEDISSQEYSSDVESDDDDDDDDDDDGEDGDEEGDDEEQSTDQDGGYPRSDMRDRMRPLMNMARAPRLARLLVGHDAPQSDVNETDTPNTPAYSTPGPAPGAASISDLLAQVPALHGPAHAPNSHGAPRQEDSIQALGISIANQLAQLMGGVSNNKRKNAKRPRSPSNAGVIRRARNPVWDYPELPAIKRSKRVQSPGPVVRQPPTSPHAASPGQSSLWALEGTARPSKRGRRSFRDEEQLPSPSRTYDTALLLSSPGARPRNADGKRCWNCSLTNTTGWLKGPHGQDLCASCGKYYELHLRMKPFDSPTPSVEEHTPPGEFDDEYVNEEEVDADEFNPPQYGTPDPLPSNCAPILKKGMTMPKARGTALGDEPSDETSEAASVESGPVAPSSRKRKDGRRVSPVEEPREASISHLVSTHSAVTGTEQVPGIAHEFRMFIKGNSANLVPEDTAHLDREGPHSGEGTMTNPNPWLVPTNAVAASVAPEDGHISPFGEPARDVLHEAASTHLTSGYPANTSRAITDTPAASDTQRWKSHFSDEEDALIIRLKEYEGLTWDTVNQSLPYRSQYSIQQRYRHYLAARDCPGRRLLAATRGQKAVVAPVQSDHLTKVRGIGWQEADDTLLLRWREDDQLAWDEIAPCFPGYTLEAIQHRYEMIVAAKADAGRAQRRFNGDEDAWIVRAREINKLEWVEITKIMPNRALSAIQGRYTRLLAPGKRNTKIFRKNDKSSGTLEDRIGAVDPELVGKKRFTAEDDSLILCLRNTHQLDWKDIAARLPGRRATTILHRYMYISETSKPVIDITPRDLVGMIKHTAMSMSNSPPSPITGTPQSLPGVSPAASNFRRSLGSPTTMQPSFPTENTPHRSAGLAIDPATYRSDDLHSNETTEKTTGTSAVTSAFTSIPQSPRSTTSAVTYPVASSGMTRGEFVRTPPTAQRSGPGSRRPFSSEEDDSILTLRDMQGCTWEQISLHLEARSADAISARHAQITRLDTTRRAEEQSRANPQSAVPSGRSKTSGYGSRYSKEEDFTIITLRNQGLDWSQIAAQLPGRTSSAVATRWFMVLRYRVPESPSTIPEQTVTPTQNAVSARAAFQVHGAVQADRPVQAAVSHRNEKPLLRQALRNSLNLRFDDVAQSRHDTPLDQVHATDDKGMLSTPNRNKASSQQLHQETSSAGSRENQPLVKPSSPEMSAAQLLCLALEANPSRPMHLQEICDWIQNRFEYYRSDLRSWSVELSSELRDNELFARIGSTRGGERWYIKNPLKTAIDPERAQEIEPEPKLIQTQASQSRPDQGQKSQTQADANQLSRDQADNTQEGPFQETRLSRISQAQAVPVKAIQTQMSTRSQAKQSQESHTGSAEATSPIAPRVPRDTAGNLAAKQAETAGQHETSRKSHRESRRRGPVAVSIAVDGETDMTGKHQTVASEFESDKILVTRTDTPRPRGRPQNPQLLKAGSQHEPIAIPDEDSESEPIAPRTLESRRAKLLQAFGLADKPIDANIGAGGNGIMTTNIEPVVEVPELSRNLDKRTSGHRAPAPVVQKTPIASEDEIIYEVPDSEDEDAQPRVRRRPVAKSNTDASTTKPDGTPSGNLRDLHSSPASDLGRTSKSSSIKASTTPSEPEVSDSHHDPKSLPAIVKPRGGPERPPSLVKKPLVSSSSSPNFVKPKTTATNRYRKAAFSTPRKRRESSRPEKISQRTNSPAIFVSRSTPAVQRRSESLAAGAGNSSVVEVDSEDDELA